MVIGASVRQKSEAAARHWRQLRFKALRRQLVTPYSGEIRLPLFSRFLDTAPKSTISLRVETNREELIRWFQLEYFGFFHSTKKKDEFLESPTSEVCVHVGPPNSLGYPYTLTSEIENFTEAVRRSEEHAAWKETNLVLGPHSKRWITQPLLDGFVSRCVMAHVGLTSGNMPQTLAMARQLKLSLSPSEVSPYYFANEPLSSWGIFGAPEPSGTELCNDDVTRLVQLAHASAVLPTCGAVWMNGAALCNENGDVALILGPRRSGKTTLALHCLAVSSPHLRLIGIEAFHLAHPNAIVGTKQSVGGCPVLLMGIPASVKVGIGALLGTLRSNPILTEATQTFNYTPSIIQQILQNSEHTIWNMGSRHQVHISEAFGPQRWCPAIVGRLKGIVLLNWDVEELSISHSRVNARVLKWETKRDSLRLLTALAGSRGTSLFKGHYLIRSLYDENTAMTLLKNSIYHEDESAAPPLYELRGSVSFDMAVRLISDCILNT